MRSIEQCSSIPDAFFEVARELPEREVYTAPIIEPGSDQASKPRKRLQACYREVRSRVQGLAQFLRNAGLRRGDRVAIISQTRPEWMEADLGVLAAGGVVVAVYPSLLAQEIGYLLFDSGARIIVAENQEQVDKLSFLLTSDCPIPATEERPATNTRVLIERIVCFEEAVLPEPQRFLSAGVERIANYKQASETQHDPAIELHEKLARSDLASLVYTSGTTGAPKGVMQTHGNHLSNIRQARDAELFFDSSRVSLFLPLAHAFAKLMGYLGFLTPAMVEFPAIWSRKSSKPDPESVTRDIREGRAHIVPAVPRIFEKMQSGVLAKADGAGPVAGLLRLAINAAKRVYSAKREHQSVGALDGLVYSLTGGIRRKIKRQLFGTEFQYAISGGAKLQVATNEFFESLGIMVLEGYGLTETVVATNINRPNHSKIGTVGPVLAPDIEVKIADDGEICFRGPNVALGYYNRPAATAQSWDDERWFHTGDLGSLDADKFLKIEGRKKELIVTAGGKKVPPDPIEQKIKGCKFVSQVMMYGDERPYCIALITLNMNAVEVWAHQRGLPLDSDFAANEEIRKEIWQFVQRVNESLASFESIKRIRVLAEDFSIENGQLTPTLKVRRREVVKKHAELISQIYDSPLEY